jgi:Vacuolar sorting protein 9 (VPS9) domain
VGTHAELQRLNNAECRSAKQKLQILVDTHKLIVGKAIFWSLASPTKQYLDLRTIDRLNSLPPVPVKTDTLDHAALSRPGKAVEMGETRSSRPSSFTETEGNVEAKTTQTHDSILTDSVPGTVASASSSADLILPLLIFTVVQSNPRRLVSNLLFIQRYRPESLLRGQAAYCLVNFSAVVEFLLNVDMGQLGLSAERILRSAIFPS